MEGSRERKYLDAHRHQGVMKRSYFGAVWILDSWNLALVENLGESSSALMYPGVNPEQIQ